jgi:hypothetical protein
VELRQVQPSAVLSPDEHLRLRLPGVSDRHEVEVRLSWDPDALRVLLSARGAEGSGFWAAVRDLALDIAVPRDLAQAERRDLPPLLPLLQWLLVADPREQQVRAVMSPERGYAERPLRSSQVMRDGPDCLVVIPWAALAVKAARPQASIGLGLSIDDRDGGRLEWFPDRQWGWVALAR